MTKDQFIEVCKGILTSGDANPDLQEMYHEGRINLIASMAFSQALYEVFRLRLDEKDLYTKDYAVNVLYDTEFEEYYSELPDKVIQMPENSGMHKISPLKEDWSFNPISTLSQDVFNELEVGSYSKDPSYSLKSTKVVYRYYDWKQKLIKKVRMSIVRPLESYDGSEEIYIPAGKEDLVLGYVLQVMSNQVPDDNNPNSDTKQI